MHHINIKLELEHHHKDCYAWALHCCNADREMAYDVVQASYLKILERQKKFSGKSAFKTWAFAIIRNTAIDELKKRKKDNVMFHSDENNLYDTAYDAELEKKLDQKLSKLFFTEGLNRLSGRQREIMQLIFYHDLSLNESAEVLHLSTGAIRKYYDRAKKTLAKWFHENGIQEL